jgi:tol-pal system protein YbgF
MSWLVFLSIACVLDRTSQSAPAQMQQEIRDNAVRVYNVEQQFVQVEARVNQLEDLNRSSGKRKILQMETLEEVRGEVVKLRGAFEVLNHDAGQGAKDLKGAVDDARFRVLWLETRADQLERSLGMKTPAPPAMPVEVDAPGPAGSAEQRGAVGSTAKDPLVSGLPTMSVPSTDAVVDAAPVDAPLESESPTEVPPDPVTEPALDPAAVLKTVKKLLKDGNHVGAETLVNRFLVAFPNHARADEATYRRAEASKVAGDYEKAVLRYQEVIDQFKASSFAPWAMLRQGEVFEVQGQQDNAKVFYGEVIRIYPKTRAAKAARKALSK